ncbi:hypothetical protein [Rubrobacter indicoceani]|uniref:hypothetical protein n=1 Tax=Rubrobacter indicoceani TaxID=2051957 RepID=UPI0013C43087|nr:hypothetical protein [Rubrobacter indicoceani]
MNGKSIYLAGTLASIAISVVLYFQDKRESAIFVGLWAPTIVSLGQTFTENRDG